MSRPETKKLQMSIKTKVTVTVLAAVTLLIIIIISAQYFYFQKLLKNSVLSQQSVLVTEIANQLNGRIEMAQRQLSILAKEIGKDDLRNLATIQMILDSEADARLSFNNGFLVVGGDGRIIAESPVHPERIGKDMRLRSYVSETLRTGKSFISEPYKAGIPPYRPVVTFAEPIISSKGKIIGLLAGRHSLGNGNFLTSISTTQLGNKGYLYILHGRTILMHPETNRIIEVVPEGKDHGIDRALKGFEGSMENYNSNGLHLLSSFKKIGRTGWILGANIPYDVAIRPLNELALNSIVIAVLGILLSLVVLWYVTRRVTFPLVKLSEHIDTFGTGKLQWQPFELHTGDEIELLATAFNASMLEVQNTKQMLMDEKDFFSGIIQNAAAPMLVLDRNHNIIFWNNALEALTGHGSCRMIGTNQQWMPFYDTKRPVLADLVLDHSLNRVDEFYSKHSSSLFHKDSLQAEGWYENLGGKRRYIFFEAAPIKNSNNEVIAVVETLEDITERKLAQEESATYSLFLREIMSAIPNPVYYKNTEGVYLGCNAAYKEFFGKTETEIIGSTLQDIMHEDYTGQSMQKDRDIINSLKSIRYETELIRSDGQIRNVLVSKAPFTNADGSLAGIVGAFVDITEQRQMDDQIRKMSRALEQSPATIVITNLDGIIEYVNPKFSQTTGYTAEEAIGQHTRVLKSGEMSAEEYTELWQNISSGKEWRGEFHNKRKDGTLYWEYASISPLLDSNGMITSYLAVKEDITERKKTEQALFESETRLNKVVNAAQDAIIMLDPDGAIFTWNDSAVRIFGYSAQEVIGRNFHLLIAPERFHKDHFTAFEKFRKTGEGGAVGCIVELSALRKNREEFPVELALSAVELNNQWHAIGVLRDISERKFAAAALELAQKELEEKHAELTSLFQTVEQAKHEWEVTLDHLRDFVILTDDNHHVRRYNRLLAEMSGKPANELVGEDWRILLAEAGFRFVAFNGNSGEVFHERSARNYDLNVFEIKESGVITGFVVSINDTTELRLAGQELQIAYAELKDAQMQIFQQEKMASIGQLAAGVAHEINNPMGFISSNLGTLNKYVDRLSEYIAAGEQAVSSCGGGSGEADRLHELRKRLKIDYILDDARQLIDESQDGAGRVRRIVQDLKSFSRVDQAEKALINLNEALETTINIAWNEIKYVAVLNREFGDIPEILCFPQQLNQVFLNLLVNSAHAMEGRQGSIDIRTWSEQDSVFVSVADTGCGIPEEIRQRIFEPFFTTKEVGKGTGLGLSISYEIIRKHGGEIIVKSEMGAGTTFIVRLPLQGQIQEQNV